MDVERFGVTDVVRPPHPIDELAPGEYPAHIAQQVLQQVEFLERQPDPDADATAWRTVQTR